MKTKQTASSPHSALTHHPRNSLRAVCLACAAACMFAIQASALIFDDGGVHVLNSGEYSDIYSENGSTVILEEGVSVYTFIEVQDSSKLIVRGGTIAGYYRLSTAIRCVGDSEVIVYGGDFNNFQEDQAGAAITGRDNSKITIYGGDFGTRDVQWNGNGVIVVDSAELTIHGGNFGGSHDRSGQIIVHSSVPALITGGNFGGSGIDAGKIRVQSGSVVLSGTHFDPSLFNFDTGGVLGLDFCSGEPASLFIGINPGVGEVLFDYCDSDGDGLTDDVDACPLSDTRGTVWIGDTDSGVSNDIDGVLIDENGCTLADLINGQLSQALDDGRNHGQLVSRMSHYFNLLKKAGVITGSEKGALMRCL